MIKLPPYYSLKHQLVQEDVEYSGYNELKEIEDKFVRKRKTVQGLFNEHFAYFE